MKRLLQGVLLFVASIVMTSAYALTSNSEGGMVAGNPTGRITIAEFFDYQCPACRKLSPVVKKAVRNNPSIRVIYINYPIFGGASQYAALASIAAANQNKYVQFHNALMKAKLPLTQQSILKTAHSVGLNVEQLKKDMQSNIVRAELRKQTQTAEAFGIQVTPTIIVAATRVDRRPIVIRGTVTYSQLQAAINQVKSYYQGKQ